MGVGWMFARRRHEMYRSEHSCRCSGLAGSLLQILPLMVSSALQKVLAYFWEAHLAIFAKCRSNYVINFGYCRRPCFTPRRPSFTPGDHLLPPGAHFLLPEPIFARGVKDGRRGAHFLPPWRPSFTPSLYTMCPVDEAKVDGLCRRSQGP